MLNTVPMDISPFVEKYENEELKEFDMFKPLEALGGLVLAHLMDNSPASITVMINAYE